MLSGTGTSGSTYTVSPANGATAITSATMTDNGFVGIERLAGQHLCGGELLLHRRAQRFGRRRRHDHGRTQAAIGDMMTVIGSSDRGLDRWLQWQRLKAAGEEISRTSGCSRALHSRWMRPDIRPVRPSRAFAPRRQISSPSRQPTAGSWRSLYKFNDGGIWADHSSRRVHRPRVSGTTLTVDVDANSELFRARRGGR